MTTCSSPIANWYWDSFTSIVLFFFAPMMQRFMFCFFYLCIGVLSLSSSKAPRTTTPRDVVARRTTESIGDSRSGTSIIPRSFRGTHPLFQSPMEREYLTSLGLRVSKYSVTFHAGTFTNSKYAPDVPADVKVQRVALGATLPARVMTLLCTPSTYTLQEGIETITVDPQTGKVTRNEKEAGQVTMERLAYLASQDLQNIRDGIYPLPSEFRMRNRVSPGGTVAELQELRGFIEFGSKEMYTGIPDYDSESGPSPWFQKLAKGLDLPEYYHVDFHSIDGGFLDPRHARVYDSISENVFLGTHFMSRRMTFPPIFQHIQRCSSQTYQGPVTLLDMGTGPGSYLGQLREAFPSLELHGLDLSPAMLEYGDKTLNQKQASSHEPVTLMRANMEDVPMPNHSYDIVTVINCFHEMPDTAIANTAKEISRLLKPGGLVIHLDAMQLKDDVSIASLSRDNFDAKFNEPYLMDWMQKVDLDAIFESHGGLIPEGNAKPFFVSTLRCYRKPLLAP